MDISTFRPQMGAGHKVYIETYGCQMNTYDSEIVISLLESDGYIHTDDIAAADVILVNTCSIRDNAEQRIWGRLKEFKKYKEQKRGLIVGVLGCMAERLRVELMEREQIVDIVAGPDSYRDLPSLLRSASVGNKGINVLLSAEETYAEISPVRLDKNGVSASVSIMRGCNNFCAYCVVPHTRGRERSRDTETILNEIQKLFDTGYREVTLLGQNVNSYSWDNIDFPDLLKAVAGVDSKLRVRFSTSHPKDLSDKLIEVIASTPNICRSIHLPAQSGSNRILKLMNRNYTREWYMERMQAIRNAIPDCGITTDIISGFCSESDADHADTLSLMESVGYDFAYMYKYSERPDTHAAKTMADDVPAEVKTARLTQVIELQRRLSLESNQKEVGKEFEVLVERSSKRDPDQLSGRTSQNKVVVFDRAGHQTADYVKVRIIDCTSATLIGKAID